MIQLLLIDVALCALLVVVAGCIMLWRRRRRRDEAAMRAGEPPGTAAELAGDGMAGRDTAVVPGFGHDPEPDPGVSAPAGPEQAGEPQVSRMAGAAPDPRWPRAALNGARAEPAGLRVEPQVSVATGPAPHPDRPGTEPDAPRAEPAGLRVEPQVSVATGPAPHPDRPGTEPDAPRAASNGQSAAGAATTSDRIGSYYDEADRAMSDYLAAMGWTEGPQTHRTR